ncbi:sensor histidine kinase inhibitor, KipI family [Promicromonospora umidemergens]|uniref:5-oxoprolinase/urea amidolyase family protein n=1 Tax=Promicromonospora umidemergens TaxID=629679 RepID=A0ABP8WU48_9MICO|nr:urea amidolyase family protein [Promicromonospora umidemergens]MCP2283533.1 sensor histidine kinase inhibitor, KipI family [Promicromonospora umidemergens]
MIRVLTARDDALLVELDDLDQAVALYESLTTDPVRGVGVPVPGARTLLVPFRPSAITAHALAAELRTRPLERRATSAARTVEIPVRYDGADLAEAAELIAWSTDELVRRHTAAAWTVGFVGFAPGFAYLTSDDPELVVPRRASPRTRVPAGSVALAGPYSGVYPRESPGGWQLVGRTDALVWDVTRERPALLLPGDEVRFVAVRATAEVRLDHAAGHGSAARTVPDRMVEADLPETAGPRPGGVEIVSPGVLALVQDLGRPGSEGSGVSASGALDRPSLRAANRAVGNPPDAAVVESVGGLRLRAHGPQVLAVTGAAGEIVVRPGAGTGPGGAAPVAGAPDEPARHDRRLRSGEPFALDDGDVLRLAAPGRGLRAYVAVRGGIDVPPVLGSRATDVLAGLGPDPLGPGDLLPVGAPERGVPAAVPRSAPASDDLPAPGEITVLPIVLGPRDDWFDTAAIARLTGQDWLVTPRSNRIGLRLDGDPLARVPEQDGAELPSEGCVTGAVQVPPDGLPVLFLADHPLTGGYPVVGAVVADHVPLAGQLPAGALVRFEVRGRAPAALPSDTVQHHPGGTP